MVVMRVDGELDNNLPGNSGFPLLPEICCKLEPNNVV